MPSTVGLKTYEFRSPGLPPPPVRKRWFHLLAVIVGLLLIAIIVVLAKYWPFTQNNVVQELEHATSSKVVVGSFRRTVFPRPGCIAENVILTRGKTPETQSRLTIQRLVIEGNWTGLLNKHLALMRLEGAQAVLPPYGRGEEWQPSQSEVIVDELLADDAMLEFVRRDSQPDHVRFPIQHFIAHHLSSSRSMEFELRLTNPTPKGEVTLTGSFGPWKMDALAATPLSGDYSFQNVDLGTVAGIRGAMTSRGKFNGTLDRIAVDGETNTPDFGLKEKPHALELATNFHAEVETNGGDVKLKQVQARLARSLIRVRGAVAGEKGHPGKTTALDWSVRSGRIQDLMLLFITDTRAPLNGTVSLKGHSVLRSGDQSFYRRLLMNGDFGIEDASFTKDETQKNLDKLSESARGHGDSNDDPQDVVSDLQGHVVLHNGVATFSGLSFRVPGAKARMNGTFDLITHQVDLRGLLFMDANLPKATSGIKSFLLKAIDPFLKKNRRGGARIPIAIQGTYEHPVYKADPV